MESAGISLRSAQLTSQNPLCFLHKVPHTLDAVRVGQWFANKFVDTARWARGRGGFEAGGNSVWPLGSMLPKALGQRPAHCGHPTPSSLPPAPLLIEFTRRSSHKPESPEQELADLIYSTAPVFSARFEVGGEGIGRHCVHRDAPDTELPHTLESWNGVCWSTPGLLPARASHCLHLSSLNVITPASAPSDNG
jgi:hypothetical protein